MLCNKVKRYIFFLIFFLNFIVQKPKMLEITSNFGINLDLFELATFGTNSGHQSSQTARKLFCGILIPFPTKRYLEIIHTLVFFSGNLTLPNAPGAKVQQIVIRKFWWPLYDRNEARKLLFQVIPG